MPLISTQRPAASKEVVCTHCAQPSEVARRAMSVFCPHCHKRVILENYKIRGYYGVTEFATCGDIVVERSGHVVAPVKVSNMTVKGKVKGHVTARGKVEVRKTGSIKGDVEARSVLVEKGGMLDGFLRVGPLLEPS